MVAALAQGSLGRRVRRGVSGVFGRCCAIGLDRRDDKGFGRLIGRKSESKVERERYCRDESVFLSYPALLIKKSGTA